MTTPTDHDLLIRMDAKLDLLVGTVQKHDETLTRHGQQINEVSQRVTVLETEDRRDSEHATHSLSVLSVIWGGGSVLAVMLGILVTYLVNRP